MKEFDPTSRESQMRQVLVEMTLLPYGKTQSFAASSKGENDDPRPQGESRPLVDHWAAEWARRPSEGTLEAARAELDAWRVRQAPAGTDGSSEDDWIIRDGRGWEPDAVARRFNTTATRVRRLRKARGLSTETGLGLVEVRDNSRERVLNLASQGCTLRQIEFQTGVSKSKVQRWLKEAA